MMPLAGVMGQRKKGRYRTPTVAAGEVQLAAVVRNESLGCAKSRLLLVVARLQSSHLVHALQVSCGADL